MYLLTHPAFPARRRLALVQKIANILTSETSEMYLSGRDINHKEDLIKHAMVEADDKLDAKYLDQAFENMKIENDIFNGVNKEIPTAVEVEQIIPFEEPPLIPEDLTIPDEGIEERQILQGRIHNIVEDNQNQAQRPKREKKGFFKKAFGWLF